MYDYHITSDDREVRAVFECFDTSNDGKISYNEFIRAIVGEMNPRRKAVAEAAFHKMDAMGKENGLIELTDIKRRYNAKQHPDVISRKRTED